MIEIEQPIRHKAPDDTYRILALEDSVNIEKLTLTCRQAGHQVVPAHTIQQAVDFMATKDHIDVIIAAAHLQSESVFEFLQQVKADDSIYKNVPFLMLCADPGALALLTSPAVEIAANVLGADKYLLMPEFDANRLMEEIEPLFPALPSKELS